MLRFFAVLRVAEKIPMSRDMSSSSENASEATAVHEACREVICAIKGIGLSSYGLAREAISTAVADVKSFDAWLAVAGIKKRLRRAQIQGEMPMRGVSLPRTTPPVIEACVKHILSRPIECFRYTGLTVEQYQYFAGRVNTNLEVQEGMEVSLRKQHSPIVRIFVSMALVRGISPEWLCAATNVPTTSIDRHAQEVLPAIVAAASEFLRWELSDSYRAAAHRVFGGALGAVVCAVDGFTVRIQESADKPASRYNVHHGISGHDFLLICDLAGVPIDVIEMGRGSRSETHAAVHAVADLQKAGILKDGDRMIGDAIYWHACDSAILAPDKPTHLDGWAYALSDVMDSVEATVQDPEYADDTAKQAALEEAQRLTKAGAAMLLTLDMAQHMIASVRLVVENCVHSLKSFNHKLSDRHPHHPFIARGETQLVLYVKAIAGIVAFRMLHRGYGLRNTSWLDLKSHGNDLLNMQQHAKRALKEHDDERKKKLDLLPRLMRVRRDRRGRQLLYSRILQLSGVAADASESEPNYSLQASQLLRDADCNAINELDMYGIPYLKGAAAALEKGTRGTKRTRDRPLASSASSKQRDRKAAKAARTSQSSTASAASAPRSWFTGQVFQYNNAITFAGGHQERGFIVLQRENRRTWTLYFYHETGDEERDPSDESHYYASITLAKERRDLEHVAHEVDLQRLIADGAIDDDSQLACYVFALLNPE